MTNETIFSEELKNSWLPYGAALALVLIVAGSPPALPQGLAVTDTTSLLPGDQVTYGQVSASWVSTIPFYTLPPVLAPFLNVTSILLTVENASGTSLVEGRTFTYTNGTRKNDSIAGDVATGTGSLAQWTISGGLGKGAHIYSSSPSYTINDTVTKSFANVPREVNVLNQTFTAFTANVQIVSFWDQTTGILVAFSFSFSVPPPYIGQGTRGFASMNLTETNLWSATPDFKVNANTLIPTPGSGASQNITLTVSSLDGFAGSVQLSITTPNSLYVSAVTPSSVMVSDTSPGRADFTLRPPVSTVEANYDLSLTASNGTLSHSVNFTVMVRGDFEISTDAEFLTVHAGSSETIVVKLKSLGLNGTARFEAAVSSRVLSVSFGPGRIKLNPGESSWTIMTVSASSTATPENYRIGITATNDRLSHSIFETVIVTAKVESSILGLNPPVFYGVLGFAAATVAAGIIMVRKRRTRDRPR